MSQELQPPPEEKALLYQYKGTPKKQSDPEELSWFGAFKKWFIKKWSRADDAADARLEQERAITKKIDFEGDVERETVEKIRADTLETYERIEASREERSQKRYEESKKLIDEIYKDNPELKKNMSLALLAQRNPEIIKQFEKVMEIKSRLELERGAEIEIVEDYPQLESDVPDSDTE